jgi:uncharacterized protein
MSLQDKLSQEMKEAMRAGDQARLSVIRMLRASIKNREIAQGKGRPLTENDEMEVVVSAVKQRKEAIDQYAKGKREDLVAKEEHELKILQDFLPKPLTPQELEVTINEAVKASGAASVKDMGKVMKVLMPQIVGRADTAEVSQKVKAILSSSV